MDGSQMLVVYQDGAGNVTLSTRTGSGHSMPEYSQTSGTQLLSGSGVSGGNMIAAVELGLESSGLDVSGSNSWISAWKTGSALDSSDAGASIEQHDSYDGFSVDLSKATIASNTNPFANASTLSSGTGSTGSAGSGVTSSGIVSSDGMVKAHGIIMALAFLVGFPAGAVIMGLLGSWKIHAAWQMLAFIGMWIGFGLGKISADKHGQVSALPSVAKNEHIADRLQWFNVPHVQLGTAVVVLMILQPVLGWWHHRNYVAYAKRTAASYLHIWYGRALLVLGIVNGGIGLQLTRAETAYTVGYILVCVVATTGYAASMFWKASKSTRREKGFGLSVSLRSLDRY